MTTDICLQRWVCNITSSITALTKKRPNTFSHSWSGTLSGIKAGNKMYGKEDAALSHSMWHMYSVWLTSFSSSVLKSSLLQEGFHYSSTYLSTAPLKLKAQSKWPESLLFSITRGICNPCRAVSNSCSKIIKFCARGNPKSRWFCYYTWSESEQH